MDTSALSINDYAKLWDKSLLPSKIIPDSKLIVVNTQKDFRRGVVNLQT